MKPELLPFVGAALSGDLEQWRDQQQERVVPNRESTMKGITDLDIFFDCG